MSAITAMAAAALLSGCDSGFTEIDQRVDELMHLTSSGLGDEAPAPRLATGTDHADALAQARNEQPPTMNPNASDLAFEPVDETASIMDRLATFNVTSEGARRLTLEEALALATSTSREQQFAEEEYMLAALGLLTEHHRWEPQWFNEFSADLDADGTNGFFDSAVRIVNDFGVTQRLPYGGDVSARLVARATEDIHSLVSDSDSNSAEFILAANIPLMRGSGDIARESRVQAERDLVYAARRFERFRRQFLVDIAEDYLNLVVTQRRIINNVRQVKSLEELERREQALYHAGRRTPFETALAENATVEARDRLNSARESYRLAVDRFKIRLGLDADAQIIIEPDSLRLTTPLVDIDHTVAQALAYRLDLQTDRDRTGDAARRLENARDGLRPDLDLRGSVSIPTDEGTSQDDGRFDGRDTDASIGLSLSAPLDREAERLSVREAQIRLERSRRSYNESRDNVIVEVRGAVRAIDRARFSLQIQERGVEIAELRKASIEADPSRATTRDRTEAINQLLSAEDARDAAKRDLEVAILRYLLSSGQLRASADGTLVPLNGPMFEQEPVPAGGGNP